ncbi:MAG: NADPH-dependent FMN reductase, partial [Cyanobium sp.]
MTCDLLVISASSGENLRLAERFAAAAAGRGLQAQILDLTAVALPLYTPRRQAEEARPQDLGDLSRRLNAAPRWVICTP